jgi:hypothetical protein
MKKWPLAFTILVMFLIANKANGQSIVQTYIDPCDNKVYTVLVPISSNQPGVVVLIRNKFRTFTYADFASGAVTKWINEIFSTPCPISQTTQQTITQTVSQAASAAASAAASSAASAASSAASGAASSAAASSASVSSSSASTSSSSPSSESSSSSSGGTSSSESKSESSSSSESKSESKEEKKSESKEEKKEDKKEDKKGSKKEQARINPIMFASDLTVGEGADKQYTGIVSLGMSQSSMTGESSWGANTMIWSNLKQFAISASYTKMNFDKGKIESIDNYSFTNAYMNGNYMTMVGYTHILPTAKYGTMGYNLSVLGLLLKGTQTTPLTSYSLTGFWMKPYQINKKLALSPEIFVMSSPITYNIQTNILAKDKNVGIILGTSINYKISKRFAAAFNYKLNGSTNTSMPLMNFFLIGSRMNL